MLIKRVVAVSFFCQVLPVVSKRRPLVVGQLNIDHLVVPSEKVEVSLYQLFVWDPFGSAFLIQEALIVLPTRISMTKHQELAVGNESLSVSRAFRFRPVTARSNHSSRFKRAKTSILSRFRYRFGMVNFHLIHNSSNTLARG